MRKKKGFTLIELGVVLSIIAVLAIVSTASYDKIMERNKMNKILTDMNIIKTASLAHYRDTGKWPAIKLHNRTNREGFLSNTENYKNWNGPYLESWPKNPINTGKINNIENDEEKNYQLDYFTLPNSTDYALVVEVSLYGLNNQESLRIKLDKLFDNGDGQYSGEFRWVTNNEWPLYIIQINPTGVVNDPYGWAN